MITYNQNIDEEDETICVACLHPTMDGQTCDSCGDVLCLDCRYYDEDIAFCLECFIDRQREYKYEQDEW
jgi:hypothetical protein